MRLLVTFPATEEQKNRLRTLVPDWNIEFTSFSHATAEQVVRTEVIIGNVPAGLLVQADRLQWMQLYSSGATGYVDALPPSAELTCATGAYGLPVAEHLLAMLLALLKHIPTCRDAQNRGEWIHVPASGMVAGSTVLIVGLGDIGTAFARMVHALGARVMGVKQTVSGPIDGVDEVHAVENLDALLPLSDVVALALPGTTRTSRMFDARRLSLMKKDALLLNVGRGSAVDIEALCDALEAGRLGGAALDVFDPEPLEPGHRVWNMHRVLITPHIAGGLLVRRTREAVFDICIGNLKRFTSGQPLINSVDRASGYRENHGKKN